MTRPVTETCWKKTYLMPCASIRRVSSSIFSARPGAWRASSSVAGGGEMGGLERTVATLPPNSVVGETRSLSSLRIFSSTAMSLLSCRAHRAALASRLPSHARHGPAEAHRGYQSPVRQPVGQGPLPQGGLDKLVHARVYTKRRSRPQEPRLTLSLPRANLMGCCFYTNPVAHSATTEGEFRGRPASLLHPDAGHRSRRARAVHRLAPGARGPERARRRQIRRRRRRLRNRLRDRPQQLLPAGDAGADGGVRRGVGVRA